MGRLNIVGARAVISSRLQWLLRCSLHPPRGSTMMPSRESEMLPRDHHTKRRPCFQVCLRVHKDSVTGEKDGLEKKVPRNGVAKDLTWIRDLDKSVSIHTGQVSALKDLAARS